MHPNIALIGRSRSGKDTVASRLVSKHLYTRVAFADPLKEAALRINPYIPTSPGMGPVGLAELVADVGWEYAKDSYPEVRRFLQRTGVVMRDLDPDFWVNLAMDKLDVAADWRLPVVVTDCRFPNEAQALRARGFKMVRIVRPDTGADQHISETALDSFPADAMIFNNEGMDALYAQADEVAAR